MTSFWHQVKEGHTVFAYIIEGEEYFDAGRNAFDRLDVGANCFDILYQVCL